MSLGESLGQRLLPVPAGHPLIQVNLCRWCFSPHTALEKPHVSPVDKLLNKRTGLMHTHIVVLTFALYSQPVLYYGDSAGGLMHQMHISLIAGALHR